MKSYIVLRNNNESGPYTLRELRSFGLAPTDLIWIEGESTCWSHAAEINGLKTIAEQGIRIPFPVAEKPVSTATDFPVFADSSISSDTSGSKPNSFPERTNFHYTKKSSFAAAFSIGRGFFSFTVLAIGLGLCAFVMKRIVDGFDTEFSPTAEAKTIKAEVLAVNTTVHAAKADLAGTSQLTNIETVRTDTVLPKKVETKPSAQYAIDEDITPATATNVVASVQNKTEDVTTTETGSKEEPADEKPKEEGKAPAPLKAPSLEVSANDYSVGMFGGISKLELSVSNPSTQIIEKAFVEVEYLKPNGNVVKSQVVTVENISPGGVKKLAVPSSNRGVKIRYKVVNVQVDSKVAANDI